MENTKIELGNKVVLNLETINNKAASGEIHSSYYNDIKWFNKYTPVHYVTEIIADDEITLYELDNHTKLYFSFDELIKID